MTDPLPTSNDEEERGTAAALRDPLLKAQPKEQQTDTTQQNNNQEPLAEEGTLANHTLNDGDENRQLQHSDNRNLLENNDGPVSENDDDAPHQSCFSPDDLNWIVSLTFILESITCILRFGLHLESSHDTPFVAKLTGGIRIHHGYIGVFLLMVLIMMDSNNNNCSSSCGRDFLTHHPQLRHGCRRFAWSLVCSDLIHHFCVLWPITGSPHFDLVYPK